MVKIPNYIESRFEHAPDKDGFFTEVWLDRSNNREFIVTPESIIRLSRVGGEWSVSEHSRDFFESIGGKMLTPPKRFSSEEDARENVDKLVDERC
jgi:hypothetical protein